MVPQSIGERSGGLSAQVVRTVGRELQALLEEPEAAASPLLCLSQSSPSSFLRPVTVQLPLPPGVTGERHPGSLPGRVAVGEGQCSEAESLWRDLSLWPPPSRPGLCLDRTRLHLLYRAPPSATWDDITAQVALELTHLYARFQVTHFSWSVSLRLPLPLLDTPCPHSVCCPT